MSDSKMNVKGANQSFEPNNKMFQFTWNVNKNIVACCNCYTSKQESNMSISEYFLAIKIFQLHPKLTTTAKDYFWSLKKNTH